MHILYQGCKYIFLITYAKSPFTYSFYKDIFVKFFTFQICWLTNLFNQYICYIFNKRNNWIVFTCTSCSKFMGLQCLHSDIPTLLGSRIIFTSYFPFFLAHSLIVTNFLNDWHFIKACEYVNNVWNK